jgi:hypothetical protein
VCSVVASESQVAGEGVWAGIGVDDLMKYRIVEFLFGLDGERPGVAQAEIGLAMLADALGFRSIEQLQDEMRELASYGVVSAGSRPGFWQVAADEALASKVKVTLASEDENPARKGEVISALARKSLARTRAKSRGHARQGGSAGGVRLVPLRPAS